MEQIIEKEIGEILRNSGMFSTIVRIPYLPYKMELALKIVTIIGQKRDPRFVIDKENKFTFENLIKWVHSDPTIQALHPETKEPIEGRLDAGIYIAGNTGTGKSWALEIMTIYTLIDQVQIKLGEEQRPLCWPNVRADSICDVFRKEGSFEKYKKMNLIGIQDLGSEPIETLYMGNRVNVLKQILEHRGDAQSTVTLITSNLPINHSILESRYEDRVASRLQQMCNYYEIQGRDRRKIV